MSVARLICFNPAGAALTGEEEAFIARNEVESFVLFARNLANIESARALIDRLHLLAGQPLIAVDQEGGRVTRLPPPATHFPSAMAIGAAGSVELAFRAGQATARELRAMRVNVALAPVMDVNNNRANPVIGTRSFGERAEIASAMGAAWLRGAQGEGIAACAKHFPGHGDTQVDSHAGLPRIEKPRDSIDLVELAPFRAAITAGVELVMPGHLLLTALDEEYPASLSHKIVSGLLRAELGFEGVVITDALDMDAVRSTHGIPGAAAAAARAGCDLVVPIAQHEETLAALQRAVADGSLPQAQVERSAERIWRLRERLGKTPTADPVWLGSPAHHAVAQEIARRAIRVRDEAGWLPLPGIEGFAVIEFALGKATIAEGVTAGKGKLLARLHERAPALRGIALPFDPQTEHMDAARSMAAQAGGLIVVTRQALHFPAQQALVRECLALDKSIVLIAMRDPYDLELFPEAKCTIAAFDDSPAMVEEVMRRVLTHPDSAPTWRGSG